MKQLTISHILSPMLLLSIGMVFCIADLAARCITVTTTADLGKGSLRDAIELANESGDASRIDFCISKRDQGYNKCTQSWCIKVGSDLPIVKVPLIIDGYSQRDALTNSNQINQPDNACIKIALCGPGLNDSDPLDDRRGLIFGEGSDGSQVKGLSITDFPVGVEIQSNNSCIRGCFLGVDVDGITHKPNTISVLVACGADGTCIGTDTPADRNVIGGLGYKRIEGGNPTYPCPVHETSGAVTIMGSNTTVQQATVGLTAQGTTPLETPPTVPTPPVAGVADIQTTNTTIGTATPVTPPVDPTPAPAVVPTPTVIIATFPTNIVSQTPTSTVLSAVALGTTNQVTTLPPTTSSSSLSGLLAVDFFHLVNDGKVREESAIPLKVINSVISGAEIGVQIGRSEDTMPLKNVQIINSRIGTDLTGTQSIPNKKHGVYLANAADALISGTVIHYNGENGIQLEKSTRTKIEDTSVSFNGQDGINFVGFGSADEDYPNTLDIIGVHANGCTCVCSGDNCCCYKINSNGTKVCC